MSSCGLLLRKLHSWDMKMEKEEITQLGYEDGKG